MEDFQDYLEKLYIATVGDTTIKELQSKELKAVRNESYMHSQNEPRFTKSNKFNHESY